MKKNAYAKINLTLDIVSRRPDGYHNVDMIMQKISLCDTIHCRKIFSGIELDGTGILPYDSTNLAYKAAKLFFDYTGIKGGVRIYIKKRIPMCAGMAGGSTDAATVLSCMNELWGMPLGKKVLAAISTRLGADVPFCLGGSTARAQGIGEVLTPLPSLPPRWVVVTKPPISVSTPVAYASVDLATAHHPDSAAACKAIEGGDAKALYSLMGNTFEDSIFRMHPSIGAIKERILSMGASAALMTGSGSAVFGIFEEEATARSVYDKLAEQYRDTFICTTLE